GRVGRALRPAPAPPALRRGDGCDRRGGGRARRHDDTAILSSHGPPPHGDGRVTNTPPPSTPNPVPAVREADQLQARLEAERDGTAYWRAVAQQRRVEAARVQKRPLVRAAIAVDR